MNPTTNPQLDRFLPWLRLQARKFHLDGRFRRRFGYSDLVQNAMVKALENLGQHRGDTDAQMMRWLHEILRSQFMDLVRHNTAQKRHVNAERQVERDLNAALSESIAGLDKILEAPDSSPSERVQKMESELLLAAALEQLPENQRDVVILFHYEDVPIAEISRLLECTEKSVTGLLDRGRKRLRTILQNHAL